MYFMIISKHIAWQKFTKNWRGKDENGGAAVFVRAGAGWAAGTDFYKYALLSKANFNRLCVP
jgi:hypothetical protein